MTGSPNAEANLPNFVCIGVQKGGTTWLYEMLGQNPSVWLPPIKEIHYFDRIGVKQKAREVTAATVDKKVAALTEKIRPTSIWSLDYLRSLFGGPSKRRQAKMEKFLYQKNLVAEDFLTEDWYRNIFSDANRRGRISGDVTPAYFPMKRSAIAEMKTQLPDAKIILMIREPLSRDISQVRMAVSRQTAALNSQADWQNFMAEYVDGKWRGDYATLLPRWQKIYPSEQMLLLPFGDIKRDPSGLLKRIEAFIGATPFDGYESLFEPVHRTKDVELPDWLVEQLKARAKPHADYLVATFGQEFYEATV
jgi:hypothetical protein